MNIKYLALCVLSFPLLPILYFQGRRIYNRIPVLPEATGNAGIE